MNHIVWIIFDSCRYDSLLKAHTPNIERLGAITKKYSYASWTSPSHYTYLMGLMPHSSPQNVFASEVYKTDFKKWQYRCGNSDLSFRSFLPHINLPTKLRTLGYKTVGKVSLPVLNPFTTMKTGFDDYKLMENHFDFPGMVEEISFEGDKPYFYFLNIGETHYPYMLENLPHVSGVHGVIKKLDEESSEKKESFFDNQKMKELHEQQINCVEYLDIHVGKLFEKSPENTWFIVTADHGELFGENGYFGHGPVFHEKVFEVPFVEGTVN